jgi:succinylglutamate desuccinylase
MATSVSLSELDHIPDGLLNLPATELHKILDGPTLISLQGRRSPPLLVSVLLHGNEDVGWEAIRELLPLFEPGGGSLALPRSLHLFIGNIAAAKEDVRHLPSQPDYNRIWPGNALPHAPEHDVMQQIYDKMETEGIFASIDIHNNTGINPHYACVNDINTHALHLAALFSRTVVYFLRPIGVQSVAMTNLCPALTLECGKVGQSHGVEHAREFLQACLNIAELPDHPISQHDIDLYHTVANVKISPELTFGFDDNAAVKLSADLELMNFRELARGTSFGSVSGDGVMPFIVRDEKDKDVSTIYFLNDDGEIRTRSEVMPSMLTKDLEVIRQDCLCYLMERYDAHLRDAELPTKP